MSCLEGEGDERVAHVAAHLPHGGLRSFDHKSTYPEAIHFKAWCGTHLVTLHPGIEGERKCGDWKVSATCEWRTSLHISHTVDYGALVISQLAQTQFTLGPYVVQIWSRHTLELRVVPGRRGRRASGAAPTRRSPSPSTTHTLSRRSFRSIFSAVCQENDAIFSISVIEYSRIP